MTTACSSVLVIGGGLAGSRTVAALRQQGFGGRITLVGAERTRGYDRPPLSKELLSRTEPSWFHDDLGLDVAELCDELVLGDPVVALRLAGAGAAGPDAAGPATRHTAVTAQGRELSAGAVVIATGSSPVRVPGWERALVLGTADDAAVLRDRLASARTLVVVGAGWIGAEVAGVAAGSGVRTTVVEAQSAPLTVALGQAVGERLAAWYPPAGVELRTSSAVATVGEDGVRLLDGGVLEADVVLSAVGARPATAWLAGTLELTGRGGVRTDAAGQVLHEGRVVPGLLAVGDCAVREDPAWGVVPAGHWSAALHDPEIVASTIMGTAPEPAHVPYVFSVQLGHDLGLVGLVGPADEVVERASSGSGWSVAYLRGELLRGVLATDLPREVVAARKVLRRGPVRVDRAALTEGRPLREVVLSG